MAITTGNTPNRPDVIPAKDLFGSGSITEFAPHQPNSPFILAHHPKNWDVVGGELLPKLRNFPVDPGVNGVDAQGNSQMLQAGALGEGWTLLDPRRVGDYSVGTKVRNGVHWHRSWVTLRHQFGSKLPAKVDMGAYNDFRRKLIADGVIRPPSDGALAMHAARLDNRVRTRESFADKEYGKRQLRNAEDAVDDFGSAVLPGDKTPKRKAGSILCGVAATDRATCDASTDVDDLRAALIATTHKTVERVITARLVKLGA